MANRKNGSYAAARGLRGQVQAKKKNTRAYRSKQDSGLYLPKIMLNGGVLDKNFIFTLLLLMAYGWIMLYSASYATGYHSYGDSMHYARPQALYSVLGFLLALVLSKFDYHILKRWTKTAYIIGIVMLIAVFVPGLGMTINGCTRWLKIRFLPSLQPSEICKFTMIMVMANALTDNAKRLDKPWNTMFVPMGYFGVYAVLLNFEPHRSAMILIGLICLSMMFLGGVAMRWFFIFGGPIVAGGVIFVATRKGYIENRLSGWLQPFSDVKNTTLQIAQSLYSIGNGGLFGVGPGNSNQKQMWLPEAQNDFVFSILCEELGFVGAAVCIALFAALIIQGVRISLRAPDRYGALIGLGVMTQITWQMLFNIAVVTNTVPNTGISLPFFSSGGTSLMMLLAEIGVLMSVDRAGSIMRQQQQQKKDEERAQRYTEERQQQKNETIWTIYR